MLIELHVINRGFGHGVIDQENGRKIKPAQVDEARPVEHAVIKITGFGIIEEGLEVFVIAIQHEVNGDRRILFFNELQFLGRNAAMRAGKTHEGDNVLALAQALWRLVDLIVFIKTIEFQFEAIFLFGKIGFRITEVDVIEDMRKCKARKEQYHEQPLARLFKLWVLVHSAETIVKAIDQEAYRDHDHVFDECLQRRHGNSGAKTAAVTVIAGSSHYKDQINAKGDQGNDGEPDGETPDVKPGDEQEADEKLEADHKTGNERRGAPAGNTEINESVFEGLYGLELGITAINENQSHKGTQQKKEDLKDDSFHRKWDWAFV